MNQSPDIAVCLLLGLDQQDWHRDKNEYYLAKANIFKYQSIQDLAVYKADDQNSTSLATVSLAQKR
ncbi:UDP-N-acetylmuramoyl-L-alanine--D-glutamate ligase, partial [Candidatus Saccharibacteria bacterium]|nr:UDP-N-acetylmuramoyl-L-alanine--D-glutamate ligase [Candidatus Saccharibacteria bacterium]